MLYGVDLAKKEIARRRQAVVVEGYTDVMACHLAGVPTAVATCGTAFGTEHIGVLRRLLLDSDEFAARWSSSSTATRPASRPRCGRSRRTSASSRPPSSRSRSPASTRATCGWPRATPRCATWSRAGSRPSRSRSARCCADYDLDTAEGRVRALDRAAPMVARIKDRALRPEYARRLAGELGMEVEPVLARVMELAGDPRPGPGRRAPARPRPDDPAVAVEREVLKLAVQAPQLAGPVFDALDEDAFTEPTYAAIRRAVAGAGGTAGARSGPEWVERISEYCPDLLTKSALTELAVERPRTSGELDERYVDAQLSRLRELAVSRQIKALRSRLQRVNPQEQPDEHTRLFGELVALEQYGRGLREQAMGS